MSGYWKRIVTGFHPHPNVKAGVGSVQKLRTQFLYFFCGSGGMRGKGITRCAEYLPTSFEFRIFDCTIQIVLQEGVAGLLR